MKAEVRAAIQAIKDRERRQRKGMGQASISTGDPVSPILIDRMASETKWYRFKDLVLQFGMCYTKIAKDFKGRDGVVKYGSDYRVSEAAVKTWLAEATAKNKKAG